VPVRPPHAAHVRLVRTPLRLVLHCAHYVPLDPMQIRLELPYAVLPAQLARSHRIMVRPQHSLASPAKRDHGPFPRAQAVAPKLESSLTTLGISLFTRCRRPSQP
jgi:hypothetical protein